MIRLPPSSASALVSVKGCRWCWMSLSRHRAVVLRAGRLVLVWVPEVRVVGLADRAGAWTRQAAHLGIEIDARAENQQLGVSRAPRNVPVVTTLHVRLRRRAFAVLDTA